MTYLLPFDLTRRMLSEYGLPLARTACTKDPNEVRWQFAQMRKPVVLKASGGGIVHKTEKGLVFLSITCREQLDDCIRQIRSRAGGDYAFLLQEQATGAELIIGGKRDPSFGPVILFGTGGIYAELLDDVSVRPAPISRKDALQMLSETHARRCSSGFRGMFMNKAKMAGLLQRASRFIVEQKGVAEFDFNPVIASEAGALIVDARVVMF